jgi:AraC-like DNA-binding protein
MNKKLLISIGTILVILTLGMLLSLNTEEHHLYPQEPEAKIQMGISHEQVSSNWSKGDFRIDKDGLIHFNYSLSEESLEPFVGLYFHRGDSTQNQFLDFSAYNLVSIDLKTTNGKRIPVFLTLDYKGFTKSGKALSWVPLSAVIEYKSDGIYTLHKQDFEIPSWWLRLHQMKKEDFSQLDFSRVTHLVINSCQTLGPGKSDKIVIRSIVFSHDNKPILWLYLGLVASTLLVMSLLVLVKRKQKVLVPFQAQSIDLTQAQSKVQQIQNYIAQHYANPELSAEDVQKALGISEREIGQLIKTHLDSSFKAYLNTIRLAEVKRLLLESDIPVSEIAYATGYNNIPHFNRVFKKTVELTPKEFRETHKK